MKQAEALEEIAKQLKIKNMIQLAYHQGQHHSMCNYWEKKAEKELERKRTSK